MTLLDELADWADADLSRQNKSPELDHYYWGYERVSEKLRELSRRYQLRGEFSFAEGDTPLEDV